jgi:membrane protein implicated in regulation of membrane protease activity
MARCKGKKRKPVKIAWNPGAKTQTTTVKKPWISSNAIPAVFFAVFVFVVLLIGVRFPGKLTAGMTWLPVICSLAMSAIVFFVVRWIFNYEDQERLNNEQSRVAAMQARVRSFR